MLSSRFLCILIFVLLLCIIPFLFLFIHRDNNHHETLRSNSKIIQQVRAPIINGVAEETSDNNNNHDKNENTNNDLADDENNNNNNDDLNDDTSSSSSSLKNKKKASSSSTIIKERPKLFHYASVSDEGTMKYQNEKGGDWHEAKNCRVVSEARPRVIICDNFLTEDQCEELIKLGEPNLQKSGVAAAGVNKKHEIRSSYGTRLPSADPLVKMIDRRLLSMLSMSGGLAERLYLLRYEKNQLYKEHGDAFSGLTNPMYLLARKKRYQSWLKKIEKRLLKQKRHNNKKGHHDGETDQHQEISAKEVEEEAVRLGGVENPKRGLYANISDGKEYTMTDRAVTTLLYLRGPKGIVGGNTSFPLLDRFGKSLSSAEAKAIKRKQKESRKHLIKKTDEERQNEVPNLRNGDFLSSSPNILSVEPSCDPNEHFTVEPVMGRLLIFYDLKEDGVIDPRSSHAGCSVLGDEAKFTITKWMQIGLP